ncbi:MAG: iron-sulfur cluster assembly protein [Candidatus Methanolliviera sp. GoM_asphalt]|nr:MAG: iron-sulfur cluster assembly protein [Candidatus Methanolliviera sp. GoM_asphalt]
MVTVTNRAADEIKKILEEEGKGGRLLRVYLAEVDYNGPRYALKLEKGISEDDVKVERNGIGVVFERSLEIELKESQIDYIDGSCGSGFAVRDQNVGGCGYNCGSCGRC